MVPYAEIDWVLLPRIEGRVSSVRSRVLRWFGFDQPVSQPNAELWACTRALYAFFDPETAQPLYIGKAWGSKVHRRVHAKDKRRVMAIIRDEYRLGLPDLNIYVGLVNLDRKGRLTHQLLTELEQLLIHQLEPCANTHSTQSYTCRDGLCVRCSGDWPMRIDEVGADARREQEA
jgi:hypothetical protein